MRDEFKITRQGKQYALFAGLLDEAHGKGLKSIDTELLQVPGDSNGRMAVVKAAVELEDGRRFSGIGDASPESVGHAMVPHLLRAAETRAKARALADAVNTGLTPFEELSDPDDAASTGYTAAPAQPGGRDKIRGESNDRGRESDRGSRKARKSQVDLLKTLAVEWRGENGVERLEGRIGKPLAELTRLEADDWIDRLTPEGQE